VSAVLKPSFFALLIAVSNAAVTEELFLCHSGFILQHIAALMPYLYRVRKNLDSPANNPKTEIYQYLSINIK
jgi:hypothetical protein